MKSLKVDKIENGYIICIDKDKKYFAISVDEVKNKVKKGDRITISDSGEIKLSNSK